MARIQEYDAPQVELSNIPNVRISDSGAQDMAAVGASDTRALGAVAGVMQQYADREREKSLRAAQLEIENSLSQLENRTLHAPDTGLLNRQGKDAIGVGQQFTESWDKQQAGIVASAPRQLREWAQQQAMSRRTGAERILMRHSVQEGQKYAESQAAALLENARNSATLNYLDPERVDEEAARAMLAADQRVEIGGGSGLERGNLRAAAASSVYRAAIERRLAADPADAAAYLETVRDRLTGEDATRLESTLRPVLIDADAGEWIAAQTTGGKTQAAAAPVAGAAKSVAEAEQIAVQSVGRTIGLESGGRADAKNPRSSATGAGQFIDGTWFDMLSKHRPEFLNGFTPVQLMGMKRDDPRRQAVVAHKRDAALSRQMTEAYAKENARGLFESGLPVTPQTVYLAHHFGVGGARKILRAAPDTPVSSLLSPREVAANPYLKGKTVSEVMANHAARAGDAGSSGAAMDSAAQSTPAMAAGKTDWVEIERRAQAIPNPLLRDRVLTRARSMQQLEARKEAAAEKARSERVITAINQNPGAPLSRVLAPEDFAAVSRAGDVPKFENYRQAMAAGGLVQDDAVLVDEIGRQAALDPQAFMRRNIAKEADRLSTPTLTRLLNMQREGAKDAAKVADWATEGQRLDQLYRLVGVGTEEDARGQGSEAKNTGRARHRGELQIAYQMAVEAHTRATGKKPEGETLDRIVRQTARNYAEQRQQRGDGEPTTRMQRNERRLEDKKPLIYEATERFLQDFSEGQREQVRAAYRSRHGQNPPEWWVDSFLARTKMEPTQ